ncbi:MAG: T9SS type A sorting domain-containing protein [Candidatus Krumholzibacteriota bacterium]|nr:T9SS type A sorting domain-containing protein [Candidatus Krumholzibacteriota bacterium]
MKRAVLSATCLIFLGTSIPSLTAAQYSVAHGTVTAGGGVISGSNMIYCSAGDGAAGISSGDSGVIKSGFWYLADISSAVDVAFELVSGEYSDLAVVLRWKTSVPGILGFNIYRMDENGEFPVRINKEIIPFDIVREFRDATVLAGRNYIYTVEAVCDKGEYISSEFRIFIPVMPVTLLQNRPNPFNPNTTIRFYIPFEGYARIDIFDSRGGRVKKLYDKWVSAGHVSVIWNGLNDKDEPVSSGVYYYRLTAGKEKQTRKMIILR